MANFGQMAARLVDLFGSPGTADPTKLKGNLTVAPTGNVLVGTSADTGAAADKLQVAGNLNFIGNLYRITGNMSDVTWKNNLAFQTSTVNGLTNVWALPNGTNVNAQYVATNASDPTNAGFIGMGITGTQAYVTSSALGSGSALPLNITSASNRTGFNKLPSASLTNSIQSSQGMCLEGFDGNGAQLRISSSAGAAIQTLFRDDGTNFYLLHSLTNYGTWSGWRPFTLAHGSGDMYLESDNQAAVLIGSSTNLGGSFNLQVNGRPGGQVPLALHNNSVGWGSYWYFGPDANNNLICYNQGGTGQYMLNGSTTWAANSDEQLKNIRENLTDAVAKVNQIRCIKYTWKNDDDHAFALGEDASDSKVFVGVIAQDVQKVLPEAAHIAPNGYLGVQYQDLTPLALAAIQEQSKTITDLSSKLEMALFRIAKLEQQLQGKQ
jgi:hypothetical protein